MGKREMAVDAAIQHWRTIGHPEHAAQIERAIEAGEAPANWLLNQGPISPETNVDVTDMEIPPRHGRGSGKSAWAEFATAVSDMNPEIIERMERDDIIAALESKGVIPKEGEEG